LPISVASGTFDKSASTSVPFTQTVVTTLNFTPKIIIFWTSGQSTATATHIRHGFGWTAGPTQNFSMAFGSDHAGPASTTGNNTFRRASDAYCLTHTTSGAATPSVQFKLNAFTSTGFSITYDTNNTSVFPIHYLAIGGTDITNQKAGSFIPNATAGNQDVTVATAFDPDVVFFMGANTTLIPPSATSIPHA